MQFIDLKKQYSLIENLVNENIKRVLDSGQYIMGPQIIELEQKLAEYAGVDYCVSCSSGTDALVMPLMAYEIGIGDAVFVPAFTFFATAESVSIVGATPVFIDIDSSFNIDVEKLENAIIQTINENKLKAKAIMAVDLFGLIPDFEKINSIAKKYNLILIEDAAQSFGANRNGKKSCSFGDCAATSFFPAKPLGCYGDGGAIFTNDKDLYEKLLSVRVHGQNNDNKYENIRIGLNGRMDTIQAGILLAKLTIFDEEIQKRQDVSKLYNEHLAGKVITPEIPENCISAYAQYTVLAKDKSHRDEIISKLKENNIPTAVYYPIPLHLQKAYTNLGYKSGDMPVSEQFSERVFSLPFHPYLTEEEIKLICGLID